MSKKDVHVVTHPDRGWATRTPGSERVGGTYSSQADAIAAGRKQAERNRSELVIHGRDGKIRDKDSFGNDPCPPKDRKH